MLHGHLHPEFGDLGSLLSKYLIDDDGFGGAFCVYHRGEKVVDVWGGRRDEAGRPWDADTMAISFSTTKGVTATALHVLASRGEVDIDAPVVEYWPEFSQAGKQDVKVHHLLTHTAGLHRLRGVIDHAEEMLDWEHMTDLLAAQPSDPPAGTAPGYHGITFGWLVGNVVRNVSGMSLSEFVQREIAVPLGLDGLYIGAPESEHHRVARLQPPADVAENARSTRRLERLARRPSMQPLADALLIDGLTGLLRDERSYSAAIPAANGIFTARSLARMYAALGAGGELDGARIMSVEQTALLPRLQVDRRDYVIGLNMKWRLGYHRPFALARHAGGGFGHFGFGGSGAWVDPESGLAVGFVTNDNTGASTPFADLRLLRLGGLALRLARKR
jgi:CubicO group peptidase (beta-lactamase class C family)